MKGQGTHATSKSQIKEEYVKTALKVDKGSDAQLISWVTEDFTQKGEHFACIVTSIKVKYRQGGIENNITYVVKLNPQRNMKELREYVRLNFIKEVGYYQDLVPLFNAELQNFGIEPLRMPTCLFVHMTEGEEVMILGDLRPEGFKVLDRKKGMEKEHTIMVMKEMSKIHAASTLVEKKAEEALELKHKYLLVDMSSMKQFDKFFTGSMRSAADLAEKVGGYERHAAWFRNFAPKCGDAFKEQLKRSPPFDVVCHGDCWTTNVLFRYDESGAPVDLRLLDFQVCRKASLATDLNFFMYTSLTGDQRKENLHVFLKAYHDSFRQVMEGAGFPMPFSTEELLQEYHKRNLFGFIMGLIAVPILLTMSKEALDLNSVKDENIENFVSDQKNKNLKQLDSNPLLRPRLLSLFDDMVEFGIIS
ncbi:putative Ecdysteroid kinase-containing protein 6 [Homarus americanus]|uniref:Putative Ecdysteroid kinase-containing protein 6 n=2 Tax=Homarus americanus TaxID=6706 RepID=A0A8J5K3L8_HOMAM|nr:putative Ecdysteroid kinase-containing protein 6 [Homarus americanus]